MTLGAKKLHILLCAPFLARQAVVLGQALPIEGPSAEGTGNRGNIRHQRYRNGHGPGRTVARRYSTWRNSLLENMARSQADQAAGRRASSFMSCAAVEYSLRNWARMTFSDGNAGRP